MLAQSPIATSLPAVSTFGPAVLVAGLVLVLGLMLRLSIRDAVSGAILVGAAFEAIGLITGFLLAVIGPAGAGIADRTGAHLTAIDLGWVPVAAVSWAWTWAVVSIVIAIAVNALMLHFRLTGTLNGDLWNLWHVAWMGALVNNATGSVTLALLCDVIWVAMQLKSADLTRAHVYRLTRIPGICVTHPMLFTIIWQYPIYRLVQRIPGVDRIHISADQLHSRLRPLSENHIVGFALGVLLAAIAGRSLRATLLTGLVSAAAFALLPVASGFLVRGLTPFGTAATGFLQHRYSDRTVHVGLDWAVLAGNPTIWSVAMLSAPMLLVLAFVLPHNSVLPFASLIFAAGTVGAVVLTQGDLVKSLLIMVLSAPVYLYSATWLAPYLTHVVRTSALITLPPSVNSVTWLSQDTPGVTWYLTELLRSASRGEWTVASLFVGAGALLYVVYYRGMRRMTGALEADSASAVAEESR